MPGPCGDLDVLVLDARTRPGLVCIRELGRGGLRVGAVDTEGSAPGFSSRWASLAARVPEFALNQDAYIDALLELCVHHQPRALLTAHDGTIEALRRRRSELEDVVGLALATEAPLSVAVDKTQTLELAQSLGLHTPRGVLVSNTADAEAAIDEVGLPAIVKPARSWVQQARAGVRLSASAITDRTAGALLIREMLDAGADALVQEWLSGAREALSYFIDGQGRVRARFAQRADRTSPPLGGNSVARVSIELPEDIAPFAERLVLELGLEGYSEVEFRRGRDGRAALMEINPRLSASVEVAVRAGVPFPRMLFDWAAGEPVTDVTSYRLGQRMRWLGGDLEWLDACLSHPGELDVPSRAAALRTFASAFAQRSGYDYADMRDLKPATQAAGGALRDYRRRVRRKLRGSGSAGHDTDVVVVGAGPYGLATSAHLSGLGVTHEIFGETMAGWRKHMPEGMYLKSEGFASNISDPRGDHSLQSYCSEHGIEWAPIAVPISLETFAGYGEWFQKRAVGHRDTRMISAVRSKTGGFEIALADGQSLKARRVVVATGLLNYTRTPAELSPLPTAHLTHSYGVVNLAPFAGKDVLVLGRGQSALETAVLIAERGGNVKLVTRSPKIDWASKPRGKDRKLRWRMVDPLSGLGEGWTLLAYANHPLAFHALRLQTRLARAYTALAPCGSWWMRERYESQVETHLSHELMAAARNGDRAIVRFRTSSGSETEFAADHVIAATGYSADVANLTLLDRTLRARLNTTNGTPILDRGFQSNVEGLHFVGYSAAASFGPVMRFVFGTAFAADRVSRILAR